LSVIQQQHSSYDAASQRVESMSRINRRLCNRDHAQIDATACGLLHDRKQHRRSFRGHASCATSARSSPLE
jgi:hypothetical protein